MIMVTLFIDIQQDYIVPEIRQKSILANKKGLSQDLGAGWGVRRPKEVSPRISPRLSNFLKYWNNPNKKGGD